MSDESDCDSFTRNIAWSEQLIEKLEKTVEVSCRIVQQTEAIYESRKMIESAKILSSASGNQIRRSR